MAFLRVFFSTTLTEHTLLTSILIVVWKIFLVFFLQIQYQKISETLLP